MSAIEDRFDAAVNVIRGLPKNGSYQPSNDMMLRFYSYYKQATLGPCTQKKPAFWDVVNKAKWDSWRGLGQMSKHDAMRGYVAELKKIIETMSYTDNVAQFMGSIGELDGINVDDLEAVAPDVIKTARSHPNSPFASRESSPSRVPTKNGENGISSVNGITASGLVNGVSNGSIGILSVAANSAAASVPGPTVSMAGNGSDSVSPIAYTNGHSEYIYQNGYNATATNNGATTAVGAVVSEQSDDEYIDTVEDEPEATATFRQTQAVLANHNSRSKNRKTTASGVATVAQTMRRADTPQQPIADLVEVINQLNRAVDRMNVDVQQVTNRINILELSLTDLRNSYLMKRNVKKQFPSWWPFEDISPNWFVFMIMWPFFAQHITKMMQKRK